MATLLRQGITFLVLCIALIPSALAQSATLSGQMVDAEDGQPLAGASVVLTRPGSSSIIKGVATDFDGRYAMTGITSGEYVLTVSFVGYQQVERDVTLSAGEQETAGFELMPGGIGMDDVIVTASRRQEKALEAPASISVINAEEIEAEVSVSSVDVLRNTTGVDIAQTGIDRQEVVLRGFNNAFSGAAYVLTDYRQGAIASLGVNAYNMMPISNIDLERIEVVRGPGSALYGPGVDAGVIHFITKDPFTYPGTTIAVTGGERSFMAFQGRHAGVINERLGYKITGQYSSAEDWRLDPNDPVDAGQLTLFHSVQPRDYDATKANINGLLEYRFTPTSSLAFNGGYSTAQSVFLSGIGTLQADGFGYTYGQARFTAGNFFAQAYLNQNDAGNSYVYAGPSVASSLSGEVIVDNSRLFNVQAQYGLGLLQGRENITFGADYERTTPRTEGTIIGRNEDRDLIEEMGAYVQSETELTTKLDLVLAARADYDNIYEKVRFSPRAAVVFNPTPEHSLRATFNRAFSSPGTNSLFLDIVAREPDLTLPLRIRARGAADGFTFQRNAAFAPFGTDLVAYSLNPATPGAAQPAGLPLDAVYASVYAGLAAIPTANLQAILASQGVNLTTEEVAFFVQQLSPTNTPVVGLTQGDLGRLNVTTQEVDRDVDAASLSNVEPLRQTTSQSIELGYKGIIGNRVVLAVDGYYMNKKNFGGPLLNETPFVYVPDLRADLGGALGAGIAGNAALSGALQSKGLTPQQVAQLIVLLANNDLPGANTPVALVAPVENLAAGQIPELLLTYRNVGDIDFYGVDASAEVLATDDLRLFGNVSWVSDNFFDAEEMGEEDENLVQALNASALKLRTGFFYNLMDELSVNAAARYTEGFPVQTGPYVGDIDSYFLLDLGAGYGFDRYVPGLRLDVSVYNVLDNMHREFIGAPEMGRLALARLTYTVQ